MGFDQIKNPRQALRCRGFVVLIVNKPLQRKASFAYDNNDYDDRNQVSDKAIAFCSGTRIFHYITFRAYYAYFIRFYMELSTYSCFTKTNRSNYD